MSVAVETDPGEGLGEGSAGNLLMRSEAAILGYSVGEGERIELNIGVAVDEPLLDGSDAIASSAKVKCRGCENVSQML